MKVKPDSQDDDGPSGLVPMAYVEDVCMALACVPATHQYNDTSSRPNLPEW